MTHRRIVLTGGPCGGKTTAMSRIAERLENLGFRVFMVPETPTMLFQGGFSLDGVTAAQVVELETVLLTTVMQTEESFRRIAGVYGEPNTVFLCDRGMMDTKAYVSSEMWQTILSNLGQTEVQLRDQRYDAVIHMVTAAIGAENHYTLANNTARTETPEQARDLDRKTQDAWVGHPHLRVIDNSHDFDGKVREAIAAVCRVVGVPEPLEDERKFLVAEVGEIPVKNVTVDIEQRYLLSERMPTGSPPGLQVAVEERVRKRGRDGSFVYTHTMKRRRGAGSAFEFDRRITPAEHLMARERRDPACAPIFKTRTCFVWEGNYFELDRYTGWTPVDGGHLTVLEVELEDPNAEIVLPPFVKIEREVTGEPAFSNKEIARSLMGHGTDDDGIESADPSHPLPTIRDLYDRVRDEGKVSIVLPNYQEADRIVDEICGLYGDVAYAGQIAKTPGLPSVLTLTNVPLSREKKMEEKQLKQYSKLLSLVLRHDPGKVGIELDKAGWTDIETLVRNVGTSSVKRGRGLTREILEEVVETNNKKRFEVSGDGKRIRARQGHSVPVDLGDQEQTPPECLYHGTPMKFATPIRSGGLLKMSRHAVHLSSDYETATDVGSRRGKPVIVKVRAKDMHADGFKFYLTGNGVWYTDHVPKDYLLWPDERGYSRIGKGIMPAPDLR